MQSADLVSFSESSDRLNHLPSQVREAHNLKSDVDASRGRSHAAGGDADFEARVSELYKSKKGLSPSDGALSSPPPPRQAPPETGSETINVSGM